MDWAGWDTQLDSQMAELPIAELQVLFPIAGTLIPYLLEVVSLLVVLKNTMILLLARSTLFVTEFGGWQLTTEEG